MTISGYWNTATSLTSSNTFRSAELGTTPPAPETVTLSQFLNWSPATQKAYIDKVISDITSAPGFSGPVPTEIALGVKPSGTDTRVRVYYDANGPTFTANRPPPALISPDEFLRWSRQSQLAYISAAGGGPIFLGPDGTRAEIATDDWVDIKTSTGSVVPQVRPSTPALAADLAKLPANLDPDVFKAWPPADQIAYIQKQPSQPVTIGKDSAALTVKVDKVNAGLDMYLGSSTTGTPFTSSEPTRPALATEFNTAPASLSLKTFLAWPMEDRLAYIRNQTVKPVVIGSGDQTITVAVRKEVALAGGVINRTSGDYEPIPYFYLSGSSSGTPSKVVSSSAEWLFPSIDGNKNILSVAQRPDQFYTSPADLEPANFVDDGPTVDPRLTKEKKSANAKQAFLASFATWNSGYQLEYINTYGVYINKDGDVSNDPPKVKVLDIYPTSVDANTTSPSRFTAFISPDDPTKLFIVQSLDKATIARMSLAEQDAASFVGKRNVLSTSTPSPDGTSKAARPAAFTAMAASLGLALVSDTSLRSYGPSTNGGTPPSASKGNPATPAAYINELLNAVENTSGTNVSGVLPEEARKPFRTQLNILLEQLGNSKIVSPADIQKKVDDLRLRFDRLFAFYNVKESGNLTQTPAQTSPGNDITSRIRRDYIASDGTTSSARRGYSVFLAQETRIADLATARMKLVNDDGIFGGKKLDVPYLVYKFQSLYNLSLEAEVVAETEEVNQRNDLLKTYAAIQDVVNVTLTKFTKADDTATQNVLGYVTIEDFRTDTSAPPKAYVVSMFEDETGAGQKHPLEILQGLARPLFGFFVQKATTEKVNKDDYFYYKYTLGGYTHLQWSTYGTRLSESVTIINQNSQIKMNDINSLDKERNRHFELANNALAKMSDIIANIARIG